jgi:hypothetical protein
MRIKTVAWLSAAVTLGTALGWAAAAASYQKTGTVKEVATDTFVLDLGKEQWRFYTDANTGGKEALKAGDKVTVTYKQVAVKIEAKKK